MAPGVPSPTPPATAATVPRRGRMGVPPRVGLTAEGRWLGLGGLVFMLAGALLPAPGVAALGAFVLTMLAVAHLAAVLARHRIAKVAIKLEGASTAMKLWEGRTSDIAFSLELPRRTAVYAIELEPTLSETLEARLVELPATASASNDASSAKRTLRYQLTLRGLRLGDSWLQGFDLTATVALGLYAVRAFAPCLLRTTVLPRHMAGGRPPLRATRAAADEQADLVHREKRGFGLEIRELRDFQAGDPFKHIAWSASARRGKLIAREFESDLQLSIWLLVDCSPSMFWGPPGHAKIDHALEIAADLARTLASGRDRVGLVLHDHESRLLIEAGHGTAHLTRLTQALLEAPHLVHEDRTELTDSELTLRIARWFEVHENRTFYLATPLAPALLPHGSSLRTADSDPLKGDISLGAQRISVSGSAPNASMGDAHGNASDRRALPAREPHPRALRVDEPALARACRELLARRFTKQRPILPITAYAIEPDRSIFRAFARHAGIALPRDPTPRPGGQSHGLEAALQAVLSAHGHAGAHTLLAISDFHTADDLDALRRVALTSRRHRHSLVFVMPTGDRGVLPAGSFVKRSQDARLMTALVEVAELQADENLRAAQAILRPAGAVFVHASPGDSLARVLTRLRAIA